MEQSASKFTPMNVIIWCCVAVFVAVTIFVILMLFGFQFGEEPLPDNQKEQLFKMLVVEVVAIGVAVFGKSLGIGQMIKSAQKKEASA